MTPYDTLAFQSHPTPERHPQRLASIAALFGLSPRPFSGARILEVGCGTGIHLLAQAHDLPQAEFIGIDLSREHILKAKEAVLQTGAKNIKFLQGDIQKQVDLRGAFDYIICHGLYSWVPSEVRESLLELLKVYLARDGIALLSYNALPGWSTRSSLQSMLVAFDDPMFSHTKRIAQARDLLNAQLEMLADASELHELRLKTEIENCLKRSEGFILHELLNEEACGFFLSDVVLQAKNHDLRYIGDAQPYRMHRPSMRDDLPALPAKMHSLFQAPEQYEAFFDHHYPQGIRSSLFCRADLEPSSVPLRDKLSTMYIASPLVPIDEPLDLHSDKTVLFGTPQSDTIEVSIPIIKAALTVLHRSWPETIRGDELFDLAWGLIGDGVPFHGIRQEFSTHLLRIFSRNLLELYQIPLRCTQKIPEKPKTTPLVSYQLERDVPLTTLRHEVFAPNELHKRLLLLCDGTQTTAMIQAMLVDQYRKGNLSIREEGKELEDRVEGEKLLVQGIESGFRDLTEAGLLLRTDS